MDGGFGVSNTGLDLERPTAAADSYLLEIQGAAKKAISKRKFCGEKPCSCEQALSYKDTLEYIYQLANLALDTES